jgi:TRAP-type C4-dicarboxylate transport system permease small subunit
MNHGNREVKHVAFVSVQRHHAESSKLNGLLSMAAMAIVVPYEVFGRYVLGNMSMWGSEFLQYSLV